jgi:hypothetical protein
MASPTAPKPVLMGIPQDLRVAKSLDVDVAPNPTQFFDNWYQFTKGGTG